MEKRAVERVARLGQVMGRFIREGGGLRDPDARRDWDERRRTGEIARCRARERELEDLLREEGWLTKRGMRFMRRLDETVTERIRLERSGGR